MTRPPRVGVLTAPSAPLVLDGGLATELASRGFDLSDALW